MKTTVFLISFFVQLLLTIQSDISTESTKNLTVINGTSTNSTVRQVAGQPIVIHTQIQYYDQPTLRDYQECYENLQKCKTVCEGLHSNQMECVKQCPVCPLLIKEQIVVQGVNDTDFRPANPPPINTTNIIRLTNEIHNIIDSQRGNITYNSENIVNVFQNVSRVGGKFGLGYNNTDPCCIVLNLTKSCNTQRFSTSANCHRRRHRVCSKKCSSRVMQAKRVTVCEKETSEDENEDYTDDENCYETVKYFPYHNQKRRRFKPAHKCTGIRSWPYIRCGPNNAHYRQQSICRRCHSLTFQYVLHRGIPGQCTKCFMTHASPNYDIYPVWQPGLMSHNNNYGIDFEDDDSRLEAGDWRHDRTLCRLPNGQISDNCIDRNEINKELPSSTTNPLNNWDDLTPEAQDEYEQSTDGFVDDDYYDDDYEPINRKRRHTFTPSKYSKRNRL